MFAGSGRKGSFMIIIALTPHGVTTSGRAISMPRAYLLLACSLRPCCLTNCVSQRDGRFGILFQDYFMWLWGRRKECCGKSVAALALQI